LLQIISPLGCPYASTPLRAARPACFPRRDGADLLVAMDSFLDAVVSLATSGPLLGNTSLGNASLSNMSNISGINSTTDVPGSNEHDAFQIEYKTLLFIVALWSSGKIFSRMGTPALLGEIAVGILMGPQVANWAPKAESLELYGELGLMLLMIEAGLHVDMEMLQIVGFRAMLVGLFGSLLPMAMCFPIAMFALGCEPKAAFAVSSTMATMSTGIALNILKAGGVLNQPTGQLIIAAATVNEMVNISLITELGAMISNKGWVSYVLPLVIMFLLVGAIGMLAVKAVPCLLDKVVLPRVPRSQRENVVLGLMFAAALALMPLCKVTGSSDLLGCFLAGFCFCTDERVHHTWNRQVKRVAAFLMRLFFACSIGFSIPVGDFKDGVVWRNALILFTCIITKVGMGVLAKPLDMAQFCVLGFAWGAWGEFSFILAIKARDGNLIHKSMYDAVVLAVLMSVVLCPMALRQTLSRIAAGAQDEIDQAKKETGADQVGEMHNVYYCLQTRSKAVWGQQEALLSAIFDSGCKIIDFRTFHPIHSVGAAHVVNELYLKDTELRLELHEQLGPLEQGQLDARLDGIADSVEKSLIGGSCELKISRWLPGEGTQELVLAHSRGNPAQEGASERTLDRLASKDAFRNLQAASMRHQRTNMALALENDTSQPRLPGVHHELDGFVHSGRHDAFATNPSARLVSEEEEEDDEDGQVDEDLEDPRDPARTDDSSTQESGSASEAETCRRV